MSCMNGVHGSNKLNELDTSELKMIGAPRAKSLPAHGPNG